MKNTDLSVLQIYLVSGKIMTICLLNKTISHCVKKEHLKFRKCEPALLHADNENHNVNLLVGRRNLVVFVPLLAGKTSSF